MPAVWAYISRGTSIGPRKDSNVRPFIKTACAGAAIAVICLLALPSAVSRAQSVIGMAVYLDPETQTPVAALRKACSDTTPYTPMSVFFNPPPTLEAGMQVVLSYMQPDLMDTAVLAVPIQQSGPVYQISGIATCCIPPGSETSLSVVYPRPLTTLFTLYGRGVVQPPGGPARSG